LELKDLRRYEERELRIVEEIKAKTKRTLGIADFYKGLVLKPPYTSHIDPWWVLLPFYRTLIVGIAPLNKEDFERKYQIHPRALVRLQSQGKVQLILRNRPTAYAGLDYLDEILQLQPPTYIRSIAYAEQLCECTFDSLVDEGREIMGKDLPLLDLQQLQRIFGPLREPAELSANFYAELKTLPGTRELANQIYLRHRGNRSGAVFTTLLYGALLAGPVFGSLGGCHAIPMKWTQLSPYLREKRPETLRTFPIDLGRELIDIIGLRLPENFEEALSIDSEKAKNALFELEETVKKKQHGQIMDRTLALREAINELREGVESIRRRSSRISKVIRYASLILGPVLPVIAYLQERPVLWKTIFSGSSGALLFKFSQKLGDIVSKLGMPSYVVSVYDIKESLHKKT